MMSKLSPLLLLFLASFWSLANAETLSPRGYGQVKFGAKLDAVEKQLKQVASPQKREFACDFVKFKKYPGLKFMVEEGVITRADAEKRIKNSAGVAVGARLSQVMRAHPNIRIEPHKYDENGHYLILSTTDGRSALVFEESNRKVTQVRAGIKPSVEYVEGCL